MKFKTKGSLILISLLFILIIGIGMASASEDINTDMDIGTDYQSDSIDVSDASLNDEQTVSEDSLPNYELANKSKDKLYDDEEEGGVTNDDDEGYERSDGIYADYTITPPENGTSFVEGEKIQIIFNFTDQDYNPVSGEWFINFYPEYGEDIFYIPFEATGITNYVVPIYLPPDNYMIFFYEGVVFDDFGGIEDEGTQIEVLFEDAEGKQLENPEFSITTNYNKKVYANLTIDYSVAELENLVEGDDITAKISLMDEFNNKMTEKVNLELYRNGENYASKKVDVVEGQNNNIIFENLQEGNYSLEVASIDSVPKYTNIITKAVNFTVKSNYDPDNYQIILNSEGEEKFVGNSYEIGVKLLNPSEEAEEGTVDLYLNGNFVKTIELKYADDGYSYHTVEGLQVGPNNATFLYKVRDGVNVTESANLIRYEYESVIDLESPNTIIGENATIKANLTYIDETLKKPLNENFKIIIKNYLDDEDEVEYVYEDDFDLKGSGIVNISDLEEGTYYINAVYKGKNYKYLASEEKSILEVYPKKTTVDAITGTYSTEEDVIVGIELADLSGKALKGTVNVVIDNKTTYQVNTTDDIENPVLLNLGKLAYGSHSLALNYTGDETAGWLASYRNVEFPVIYPSFMSIEDGDVSSGSDLTVNITLTGPNDEGINGTISVRIYDNTGKDLINGYFNTTDGLKSIELKNLTKDYIIHANYYELDTSQIAIGADSCYLSSEAYGFIRIVEEESEKTEYDLELTKVNDNTVIASLKDSDSNPVADAELTVKVNGIESKAITDKNGMANITFSGNSSIKVSYKDANNTTAKASMEIIIINNVTEKIVNNTVYVNQTVEVPVEIEKIVYVNQTVEVPVEVEKIVYVNQTTEIPIETEKIVYVNQTVPVYINQTVEVPVEVEKIVYINESTGIPIETEKIVYINQTVEVPVEINNTVYVIPNRTDTAFEYKNMVTTAVAAADGRIGEYFNVRLIDANGKALAYKPIKIGFNGVVYNRTTDADGRAKLQINLGYKGDYTFAIGFLGDDDYTGAFEVAKITVKVQNPELTTSSKTYKSSAKTKTLTATFKSEHGNAVSGKKISFTVNGKTYSGTTNSKGIASVNVSLSKKGTYSFTVKWAGNDQFAAVTKTGKLTIK